MQELLYLYISHP